MSNLLQKLLTSKSEQVILILTLQLKTHTAIQPVLLTKQMSKTYYQLYFTMPNLKDNSPFIRIKNIIFIQMASIRQR